ncbi:cytochrome P450 71A8 [Ziziphus jujuba]|uniref:Cytochrome P450 71A8 n=1 Tax=Ziziphus jujuba TaxID=326968 RepID=A0ABM4A2I2_ZIZJJ|nr:cytochrome P450 71A8 [Ziziphus jujuba]
MYLDGFIGIEIYDAGYVSGGTETTSIVSEWAMTALLRRSNMIMHKLQAEIRSTAAPLVPRLSRTKVEINGYEIQPGSHVYINAWAIGKDPISWERPAEFDPDRFLKSDVDYKGHDFHLFLLDLKGEVGLGITGWC